MNRRVSSYILAVFVCAALLQPASRATLAQTGSQPVTRNIPPARSQTASTEPLTADLAARQAVAYCTDRHALAQVAYPDLTSQEIDALMMDSFLPSDHWAYHSPAAQYPYDPTAGIALLEAAGWSLPAGGTYRVNAAGERLALKLTTTSDLRYAWAEVLEQQLLGCGIMLLRSHFLPAWLFHLEAGLQRRDFELTAFAWSLEEDFSMVNFYGCDSIPSQANDWQGQNFMGWCNPTASQAAIQADDTGLTQEERKPFFATLQEEFAADLPSLPLFLRHDPANVYWEHLDFNFDYPPPPTEMLKTLEIRRAVAYCTDRQALAQAAYPELSSDEIDALMMDSFLPSDHWAYISPAAQFPYDPAAGASLLEATGWTLPAGETYRVNTAGEPLALKLTTTAVAYRYAWAEAYEAQLLGCGIMLLRSHFLPDWLFHEEAGLQRRDFELAGYAWLNDLEPDPVGLFSCGAIGWPGNGWQGQNYPGWCNPAASQAARLAGDISLTQAERLPYFATLQELYAQELPSLPLFLRSDFSAWEHIDFNIFIPPHTNFCPVVTH